MEEKRTKTGLTKMWVHDEQKTEGGREIEIGLNRRGVNVNLVSHCGWELACL